MSIGLDSFRRAAAEGGRFIVVQTATGKTLQKAELKFNDRLVAWQQGQSFWEGGQVQQDQNDEYKEEFYQALVKSNGPEIAALALKAARWPAESWKNDGRSIERQVGRVLDEAQWYRKNFMVRNEQNARAFVRSRNFATLFSIHGANANLPAKDVRNRKLIALFHREIKRDPNFAMHIMDADYLGGVAKRCIQKFAARNQAAFREQYTGLATFAQRGHANTPREDARSFFTELTAKLRPSMAEGHDLSREPEKFRSTASLALDQIRTVKDLLGRMSYDPAGMKSLGNELLAKYKQLHDLELQLTDLPGNEEPRDQVGQDLRQDLISEIRHQKDLLVAKAGFLDDVRDNDPLSQKMAEYNNLLWAHAVGHVIDQAIEHVVLHPPAGGPEAAGGRM
jgi:hypothetical protein